MADQLQQPSRAPRGSYNDASNHSSPQPPPQFNSIEQLINFQGNTHPYYTDNSLINYQRLIPHHQLGQFAHHIQQQSTAKCYSNKCSKNCNSTFHQMLSPMPRPVASPAQTTAWCPVSLTQQNPINNVAPSNNASPSNDTSQSNNNIIITPSNNKIASAKKAATKQATTKKSTTKKTTTKKNSKKQQQQ